MRQGGTENSYVWEPYDVLHVSRDRGKSWADYSTLREQSEGGIAKHLVDSQGGMYGHPKADYHIRRGDRVVYG